MLDASGTVALLEPWFGNKTKSLVKCPKVYLSDAGLCSFLVGIHDAKGFLGSPLAGSLICNDREYPLGERAKALPLESDWPISL